MKNNQHLSSAFCYRSMPGWQKNNSACKSPFFSLSQFAERLAVRFALVARIYFNLFYKSMLAREIAMTGLNPGASVLHIGGGAYPFTAIFLAQRGYRVDACDCNRTAVEISRNLITKSRFAGRINILYGDGCKVDSSHYDAVWISLNICPKERVLEQSWTSLDKGGLLVYRKFPAWLAIFGKEDLAFTGDEGTRIKKALSGFGAESVVLEKGGEELKTCWPKAENL